MAEGYLKHFAPSNVAVYSAGIEAHGLNPQAVEVMMDDGIDISIQTSDSIEKYEGIEFDYVITVCDNANERCPLYPAKTKRIHHNFSDPAKAIGSSLEIKNQFIAVRNQIKEFAQNFVAQNIST